MPRNFLTGCRVVELTEDKFDHKTWIRQSDGTIANLIEHKPNPTNVQVLCR
jgi:hypothetical protein